MPLVAIILVDLAWTTVAAGSDARPLTGRLGGGTWRADLALHRRRPSHRFLTASGVAIVFVVLAAWITGVLVGWPLVLLSPEGPCARTRTGEPADAADRLYFTGYTVFTLRNGDFRRREGTWQLPTVAATGTGWF